MKLLFILFLLQLNFASLYSQKKTTFLVEFYYEQKSSFLPDSVKNKKIDVEVVYQNSSKTEKIETTTGNLLSGNLVFESIFFILANSDSSKIFFPAEDESKANIKLSVSTPDTIFYSEGVWIRIQEGILETIPSESIHVIETNETKKILGYNCIKFISVNNSPNEEIVFWASKELPNTLLPFTGLEKFKYGILEIINRKNNWHTVARNIRKL